MNKLQKEIKTNECQEERIPSNLPFEPLLNISTLKT